MRGARIDRAAKTVRVRDLAAGREYDESYDKLILAPGAAPLVPPIPGAGLEGVFTLRTVPDAERIKLRLEQTRPGQAVVVGAGFIGLEMTENLARRGIRVRLVELADQVMPVVDRDIAAFLHRELRENGVRLNLGVRAEGIERTGNDLTVALSNGERVACGLVIFAAGVRPETVLAREAGLALGERGGIKVDSQLRTSDPDIFAVGDAVEVRDLVTGAMGVLPLAGPANRQGHIAADNALLDAGREFEGCLGTSIVRVVRAEPGPHRRNREETDRSRNTISRLLDPQLFARHLLSGAQRMSIKLFFSGQDGRILGAQIVGGEGVDKRIDVLATAITAGMTVGDLTRLDLAYAPPFGSAKDPVNMAGYAARNILEGRVEAVQWDAVPDGQPDGPLLLDVRTPVEFASGHLEGAVNIPLDELRATWTSCPVTAR